VPPVPIAIGMFLLPRQSQQGCSPSSRCIGTSAEQLTNLIWEAHKEFSAGDELGIDFAEKAFYDILKDLCIKYDFTYPEDKLIELAKAVKELVDGQAKFPDWNKRNDIKSALKVGLILLLDEFGYPPVERDEVYVEIF
jgi:type I restriction enzyme R subunit